VAVTDSVVIRHQSELTALVRKCAPFDALSGRREQTAIIATRTGLLLRSVLNEELYITSGFLNA
jgi:hypothetical protein